MLLIVNKDTTASFSPYRAMFAGNMRFLESEQTNITLHDLESNILKQILSFIYTAEIQVLHHFS